MRLRHYDSEIDSDSDDLPEMMWYDNGNGSEMDNDSDDECRRITLSIKRTRMNFNFISGVNACESYCKMRCCGAKKYQSAESTAEDSSAKK